MNHVQKYIMHVQKSDPIDARARVRCSTTLRRFQLDHIHACTHQITDFDATAGIQHAQPANYPHVRIVDEDAMLYKDRTTHVPTPCLP